MFLNANLTIDSMQFIWIKLFCKKMLFKKMYGYIKNKILTIQILKKKFNR